MDVHFLLQRRKYVLWFMNKALLWDSQWFPLQKIRKLNLRPVGKKKIQYSFALCELINTAASEQMLIQPLGSNVHSHNQVNF